MGTFLLVVFILAFATEALVQLFTKSEFFEFPRKVLSKWSWFERLLACGYCTSVWVAMGLIAVAPVAVLPISSWTFVNVLITLLVVHRLSNVIHNVVDKWTDKYYDLRYVNTDKN